jgi:hypothetical protein
LCHKNLLWIKQIYFCKKRSIVGIATEKLLL